MTGRTHDGLRVVALNGSERPDGDTTSVLRHCGELFRSAGIELDVIQLSGIRMTPCGPCGDCNTRALRCGVDDDVQRVVEQMVRADGILYATPVHGFGTAALMQTFLERAGVGFLRFERPLVNKVGGALVVARRYSHDAVIAQLNQNILLNRMIVAGSGFPAVLMTQDGRAPLDDREGVHALEALVTRMAELLHLMRDVDTGQLGRTTRNEREMPGPC